MAYVVYASQEAAIAAVNHFNEYDLGQEQRLKVITSTAQREQGPVAAQCPCSADAVPADNLLPWSRQPLLAAAGICLP